jgi:cytosine/adenosine deaminase-related metal-dependent hydrolase
LQAATLNPAKFLNKTDTYGTIEVDRVADLVLLDMNPLEDISHTRKIHAVVLGGKLYPVASIRSATSARCIDATMKRQLAYRASLSARRDSTSPLI